MTTLDFTKLAIALASSQGDGRSAAETISKRWPGSRADTIAKAATAAGTTVGSSWAAPLVDLKAAADEFVELLRPQTVLGKLVGLRIVPFNIKFARTTAGSAVGWVGEMKPARASELAFEAETFTHSKIAGIVAFTKELARSSNPSAEAVVQADLVASVSAFSDAAFLDPTLGATANSPASITNGTTAIASTGSTAAQIEADLKAAIVAVLTNKTALHIIMKPSTALYLAALRDASGAKAFPDVTLAGGLVWGIPVVVSNSVGNRIVVLDAAEILLADDGAEFDTSEQATVQLDTAPADPVTAAAVMTSFWQLNLIGVLVRRVIRWAPRRDNVAAYISGVTY